ncbi:MAG: hypothetical protein WC631_03555 [Candidatus Paceibacterota bacterium]|jgi:hypothetical protein
MKTIRKIKCVVESLPRKCGRGSQMFCIEACYYDREGVEYLEECLTADGTLKVGDRCIMRTIKIIDNEFSVVERQ